MKVTPYVHQQQYNQNKYETRAYNFDPNVIPFSLFSLLSKCRGKTHLHAYRTHKQRIFERAFLIIEEILSSFCSSFSVVVYSSFICFCFEISSSIKRCPCVGLHRQTEMMTTFRWFVYVYSGACAHDHTLTLLPIYRATSTGTPRLSVVWQYSHFH